MSGPLGRVGQWLDNPYVNLVISIALMGWALHEAWDTLIADLFSGNLRLHHGVILYGLFVTGKSLHELKERTHRFASAIDDVREDEDGERNSSIG